MAKHALIGYWHNFNNGTGVLPLSKVSDDWDVIVVSFADSLGAGKIGFTLDDGAGTVEQFKADIKAKQAQGKKVVLSLGGQNGTVSLGSQVEADNFSASLYELIRTYGFDGIDLDLENGVTQGAPIQTFLPPAVKSLKNKVGPGFYLSMAPEWVYVQGGANTYANIWGAYLPIVEALRAELTVLHPQYYNNGVVYVSLPKVEGRALKAGSAEQLVASSRMLIEGFSYGGHTFAGLRPDQVAFGVPSGPGAANSGFTTPDDVQSALSCLSKLDCGNIPADLRPVSAYPTMRGVMTWSINWDQKAGQAFSRPARDALNQLP